MQSSIQEGNLESIKSILSAGHDINEGPWTPLLLSVYYDKPNILKFLIEAGADINKTLEGVGATGVFVACEHGKFECLKTLIEAGALPDYTECPSGTTPFIKACEAGRMEIVRYMVEEAKCNICLSQKDQASPFFMAAQHNHVDVARYLIENGVDVNAGKRDSATPAIVAAELGNTEIIRLIVEAKGEVDHQMYNGVTPLYKACEKGNFDIVKILVEDGGVDIDKPKNDGVSPLFTACQMGHLNIIKFLAGKGADVNKAKNDGVVPIYMAAEYRNVDIVEYLISAGADLTRASMAGLTPLHAACIQHVAATVRVLCDAGAPLEMRDRGMFTPICNASEWGRSDIVSLLLEKGADPNASGWNGNIGLHIAAWKGREEVVDVFLRDTRVDVNTKNSYGFTALHLAALAESYSIVQKLLQHGADVNSQDNDGSTPLHFAIDSGNEGIARLLYERPELDRSLRNLLGLNCVMQAALRFPERIAELVGEQYSMYLDELPKDIPARKFTEVAQRILPTICLENVKLIPTRFILEAGEFPHYAKCELNDWHVTADVVALSDKVLFVSHRWGSIEHPDPDGTQFAVLQYFIRNQSISFDYIWLDYACICQERPSEMFNNHLVNIPTAVWVSTHCVIIPRLEKAQYNNDPDTEVRTTNLADYLGRAWCILEGMACLLTGTRLFCSFQVGEFITQEAFDRPEGAASHLGFFMSYVKVWNHLFAIQQKDMMNIDLNRLETQWRVAEPCQILNLLIKISNSEDAQIMEVLELAKSMTLVQTHLEDASYMERVNSECPEIKELFDLMGECAYIEDKIVVLQLVLFIGYYSINLMKAAGVTALEGGAQELYCASSESKICAIM